MTKVRKLLQDESGVAMGLAVIMIVLISVMGAGLLVFVRNDLQAVVEVNQGQKAFELADAGAEAAERQLEKDSNPDHYDGGTGDVEWSESKGGMKLDGLLEGSASSSARVEIEYEGEGSFRVISIGEYRNARRVVEAVFTVDSSSSLNVPRALLSRSELNLNGNEEIKGMSLFSFGDAKIGNNTSITGIDSAYGKWAETDGDYSYPNPFNSTPRGSELAGVGAIGEITGKRDKADPGERSYDSDTDPEVVPDYDTSSLPEDEKIAFPFDASESNPEDLELLRQRALQLEEENPGTSYYYDESPGNGEDDEGLSRKQNIDRWPTDSSYQTVVFYEYEEPTNKEVTWNIEASCDDTSRKGIIVVENGNFQLKSNKGGFNGTVIIRADEGSDPGKVGTFKATNNNECMTGYVDATGNIKINGGDFKAGSVPASSDLPAFASGGNVKLQNWRECYSEDCN